MNYLPFIEFWREYLNGAFALVTMVSCLLLVNSMPARRRWIEKALVACVGLGACGVAGAPWVGHALLPTFYELLYHAGAAGFSLWLTLPYWRELPCFDRRKCRSRPHAELERRGTEIEEGRSAHSVG